MDKRIIDRINFLLIHIDKVLNDTKGIDVTDLKQDSLLLRATCFSIVQIGEQMVKLEDTLKSQYPNLPWKRARGMRNFIVHDYERIDNVAVQETIDMDLPVLKEAFEGIKKDLVN